MSDLDFDEYQLLSARTAEHPDRDADRPAIYPFLGIAGEAGEVADHGKKIDRDTIMLFFCETKLPSRRLL